MSEQPQSAPRPNPQGGSDSSRPNLLFIYTDDQGPWALGLSGNREAHTPHMDELFRQGAYLRNSFVTTPVCSPSRAGLMVSRYGTEVGITDWINPGSDKLKIDERRLGLDPSFTTWTELLRQAGYVTGLVGKWHLGEEPQFHPTKAGFQYFTGFLRGGVAVENPALEVDGEDRPHQGHTVDILTDYALEFIRNHQKDGPFALCLNHRSPHAPWLPVAEEDWAPYKDLDPTIPNPDFPNLDAARVKQAMREHLASVTGVDRNLGRLLRLLDELGLRDNTVVIFTSDNGMNLGHNGVIFKGNARWITLDKHGPDYGEEKARPNMYDNSIGVPTGIRWPAVIRPGTVIHETISNLDWYPTLAAIAGVEIPDGVLIRGRSFLPLLKGDRIRWDNTLYGEYSQHHYTEADLRMVRTPQWKLVRDFKRPGRDELYDLSSDPAETTNRIEDPAAQGIRQELNSLLIAKMRELNDPVLSRLESHDA